jgi:hypothetical protein
VEGWPLDAVKPSIVAAAVAFWQANDLRKARHVSTPRPAGKRPRSCDATPPPAKRQHGGPPAAGPVTGPSGAAAEADAFVQPVSPSGPKSSTPALSSGAAPSKAIAPGSPAPAPQQQSAASASVASTGHAAPADTALSPAQLTASKAAVAGQLHNPFPQVHGSLAAALATSLQGSLPSYTKQCSELC